MFEYIKQEDAIKAMMATKWMNDSDGAMAMEIVATAPTADVAPVRHGRWLQKKHKIFGNEYDYVCSECGCDYALAKYNYCPNCGAKMDGDGDNACL